MKEPDILQEFKSLDNEKYEFSIYRDLVQRLKFDLQSNKVAIARFGGPIAICRDIVSTQFFENNDMFKEDIWFYSNEGLILNKIKFPYNQRIVGFDFIYEERLVVVLENGFYYLINSFEFDQNESKRIEEKRFNKPDEDLIVEAKILENGLGFFTRSNRFYIMNNLNEGQLIDFGNPGISSEISFWSLIPQGVFLDENDVKFNLYVANSAANGGGALCIESFKWQQNVLVLIKTLSLTQTIQKQQLQTVKVCIRLIQLRNFFKQIKKLKKYGAFIQSVKMIISKLSFRIQRYTTKRKKKKQKVKFHIIIKRILQLLLHHFQEQDRIKWAILQDKNYTLPQG